MNIDELEKSMMVWPYPWPDYLELAQKVRDEAFGSAQTDDAKAKAISDYEDRLNRILDWRLQNPDRLAAAEKF
jgi:hypothetical protein